MGRVRVFIACSLDGFIAGENDDLSWLVGAAEPVPGEPRPDYGYDAFFATVGALLMGRNTYGVAEGFEAWPYADRPVLVATRRALTARAPTVRAVSGPIDALVTLAKAVAGDRDVYLDGGDLIRQALDADLVDELIVSFIPTALGRGAPLFAGLAKRRRMKLVGTRTFLDGLVQLTLRPA